MAEDALVSVITPAYKHERFVQEAMASVIAQTYRRIEYLMIDDGSSDGTFAKIQAMAPQAEARFERFLYRTRPNRGKGCTMNELIAEAQGEYVLFLDSDDLLKPEAVATLVARLEQEPEAVLAVGRNELIDGEGKPTVWELTSRGKTWRFSEFYERMKGCFRVNHAGYDLDGNFGRYEALLRDNHVPNGYLVRRQALAWVVPFSRKSPLEDIYMMLQLAKHGRLRLVPECTCAYRLHATNTIHRLRYFNKICRESFYYEIKRFLALPAAEQQRLLPEGLPVAATVRLPGGVVRIAQLRWRPSVLVVTCFGRKRAVLVPKALSVVVLFLQGLGRRRA